MTRRRTVVITGAEGDIGRAVGQMLLARDYGVEGLDIRSSGTLPYPVTAADLTDKQQTKDAFSKIAARRSQLFALINCAGSYEALNADETNATDFERVWKGNVVTAWNSSMEFSLHAADKARIVNLASISGQHGSHDVAYGTAKAGVIGLTKSLALHFGQRILVNAVSPGVVTGSMSKRIPVERLASYRDSNILGRIGLPSEVAEVIAALLGGAGTWMTGTVVEINGGLK